MAGFALYSGFLISVISLICLVDRLAKKEHGKKVFAPVTAFLLACFLLFTGISSVPVVSSADAAELSATGEEAVDGPLNELAEAMDLTLAQAKQVRRDLASAGILSLSEIKEAEYDPPVASNNETESRSYTADTDGKSVFITIEDGKTAYIGIGNVTLFDLNYGGTVNQLTDCGLTPAEAEDFMNTAETYIRQAAKYPESARFPAHSETSGEWTAGRFKNIVQIESYVNAKNGVGAMRQSPFVIQLTYDTKACLYISLGSERVFGSYTVMFSPH